VIILLILYFCQKIYVSLTLQKVSQFFTKILFIGLRTNLFYIVLSAFLLTIGNHVSYSQEIKQVDSLSLKKPVVQEVEMNTLRLTTNDTIKNDSIKKPKKNLLEGIVKRTAKDYEKLDQKKKQLTLYNEAELYYTDIELKAGIIVLDYDKNEVYAG